MGAKQEAQTKERRQKWMHMLEIVPLVILQYCASSCHIGICRAVPRKEYGFSFCTDATGCFPYTPYTCILYSKSSYRLLCENE